ncbi:hypothetical protein M885DRAFT_574786 [Pelagophyceae sp. CCMP2097]|nr:hypothetical protein M885DRAFT_574786 [Pelagophyceae sp. CCMP2097]
MRRAVEALEYGGSGTPHFDGLSPNTLAKLIIKPLADSSNETQHVGLLHPNYTDSALDAIGDYLGEEKFGGNSGGINDPSGMTQGEFEQKRGLIIDNVRNRSAAEIADKRAAHGEAEKVEFKREADELKRKHKAEKAERKREADELKREADELKRKHKAEKAELKREAEAEKAELKREAEVELKREADELKAQVATWAANDEPSYAEEDAHTVAKKKKKKKKKFVPFVVV